MDNYALADQLNLLAKLMEIHGENAFKAKAYSAAAFALEKYPQPVAEMPKEKISSIKGIGDSAGKKVVEMLETGALTALQDLVAKTPEGVLELMNIKGLGPKKLNQLWKGLGIDTVEALQEACEQNQIAAQKGFGEKTQQNILDAIRYQQENSGKFLYAQVETFAEALQLKIQEAFPAHQFSITGSFRRQWDVIDALEWVTTVPHEDLKKFLSKLEVQFLSESENTLTYQASGSLRLLFHLTSDAAFGTTLFTTTGSSEFAAACTAALSQQGLEAQNEHELLKKLGFPFIPPPLRESPAIMERAKKNGVPELIQQSDIKGIIHAHSNWSDGSYAIEEMAQECLRNGFEYLVLSDHSKAAFYANGLSEERIVQQHREIENLNKKLAPFRIFKSIECDILNDGEMDYSHEVLASFDVVIASIHSNLQMPEEKAMKRLLGAITNPYVSIMGHLTGRLLTKRKGYPVDHKALIDACLEHNVVIEINASPMRLDMDWRWIDYALEIGLQLSINPDAHTLEDFRWLKFGVLVAQKGGLTKAQNLSSCSLPEFEAFLKQQHQKRMAI